MNDYQTLQFDKVVFNMDDGGVGRGHREKIPSAKLKDQGAPSSHTNEKIASKLHIPVYVAGHDPKFCAEQEELRKTLDHTKVGLHGERTEFYTLGPHVETKEKRFYMRARRDQHSLQFHAAEAPPLYARLSDEQHPQCQIEKLKNCFTRDMLGKTGEWGNYTTKANVFAREGQFFYEARIISQAPPGREPPKLSLADFQDVDRSSTSRGGLRIGFARREAAYGEPLGNSGYSYAVATRSGYGRDYGVVRFNSEIRHIEDGEDFDDLSAGDVIGLMITLPPLHVHQKVVEGTYNAADYPHLSYGPFQPKKQAKKPVKALKTSRAKSVNVEPESASSTFKSSTSNAKVQSLRSSLVVQPGSERMLPVPHEIIRDRNPFSLKGATYFECPDYTPNIDLSRPNAPAKQKSQHPDLDTPYDLNTDTHPCHELPHLRTLPGSKIECWVNGKYKGVVYRHLLAFLPPASTIDISRGGGGLGGLKDGNIDDGLLGYFPAISHFTGGAVECKFSGPWWCGYNNSNEDDDIHGPARPDCRAFGERYREQIAEDFVQDIIDETYLEAVHGSRDWMRNSLEMKGKDTVP